MPELARGFYLESSTLPPSPTAPDGATVIVLSDQDMDRQIDAATGAEKFETEDGGVVVDLSPHAPVADRQQAIEDHNANLAAHLDQSVLDQIGSQLLEAIEADDQSRQQWLTTRTRGLDMLGFKVDEPRSSTATGAPADGMSTVRHPLLAEAVIRFQSNAAAELFPPNGPVKVRLDAPAAPPGIPDPDKSLSERAGLTRDDLAEALEKDFNHYLTKTDRGYRPDSVRMLFWTGFGGSGFKKVYNDPVLRRPVSRSVDAEDLIVNNNANDIDDAGRVTHRITMRHSLFTRMVIAGAYRDLSSMAVPVMTPDPVQAKVAEIQGFTPTPTRPEDHDHTIYECYCELDVPGFEHQDEDGRPTGLQLPYKVSIEKDSRQVLEIRRNWRQDDDTYRARKRFVKYPFVLSMGFYDTGLLHLVGNTEKALTGAWRIMLDSGMFANFPGFLYAKSMARQATNEFRIAPGAGMPIDTGDKPIGQVVMPLPYKEVSPAFTALAKEIEDGAQRLAGTAELQVAEGRQDAPVGTTLAMVEQATKILAAVHVNLHAAQAEEFELLKECFEEDPEAFWRHNRKPARAWEVQEFLDALADTDLVPCADPNTPSHMHRLMKAMALMQMAQAAPQLFDLKKVAQRMMRVIGVEEADTLFAPPPPSQPGAVPPDPKLLAVQAKVKGQQDQLQAKALDAQRQAAEAANQDKVRLQEVQTESADRAADRASRERVAQIREDTERIKLVAQQQQQAREAETERNATAAHLAARASLPPPT